MGFPTPKDEDELDTVELSQRAIAKYEYDARVRARHRAKLARETGYVMLAPGMF